MPINIGFLWCKRILFLSARCSHKTIILWYRRYLASSFTYSSKSPGCTPSTSHILAIVRVSISPPVLICCLADDIVSFTDIWCESPLVHQFDHFIINNRHVCHLLMFNNTKTKKLYRKVAERMEICKSILTSTTKHRWEWQRVLCHIDFLFSVWKLIFNWSIQNTKIKQWLSDFWSKSPELLKKIFGICMLCVCPRYPEF